MPMHRHVGNRGVRGAALILAGYAGRQWQADPEQAEPMPLPAADGNTYDDGYLSGTVTPLSPRRARFVSDDGRTVAEFEPTDLEPPPCA